MRYCTYQTFDLTAAVGGFSSLYFWANGIYDPQVSTGGHQPMGHDQWETFYNAYIVKGARAKCTWGSTSNMADEMILCGISIEDDNTSGATNIQTIQEYGGCKYKILPGYTAMQNRTLTSNFSAKHFFNCKDLIDERREYGANFGSSPVGGAFYRFFCGSMAGASIPQFNGENYVVGCNIEIEYIVELMEPKELPQS